MVFLGVLVLWLSVMLGTSSGTSHNFFLHPLAGALGSREEPEFVTARAGESVILGCDVIHPLTGQPPPYVVEWFKFGVPIPIFIKFGFYPPHVDPEYAGESWGREGRKGTCQVPAGGYTAPLHPLLCRKPRGLCLSSLAFHPVGFN